MADHIELGKKGEELAVDWLMANGFSILQRNWRYGHYEIDIIALKDEKPHFIEVKIRSSYGFGLPEVSVNRKKVKDLLKAVEQYLYKHPSHTDFRLDILAINIQQDGNALYCFIEDVYL